MAEYNLGTAHGTVKIDADTAGVDQANQSLNRLQQGGQNTQQALGEVGRTMGVAGLAIAGGLAVAVHTAANFEAELSGIQAVSGATAAEMENLHDKALAIGKDTAFSATEAAQAMQELAKAGIPLEDILGGAADATVALAAATGVDMPTAASIASNAMNVFGIKANEMDRVVNTFAQTANASAIDITDLGMSMSQVGAVAQLAGLSMEDTTMAIGQLGDAGIKGSDAGTSLKTMLMNLQPSTEAASTAMEELGIVTEDGTNRFYDQEGNLKSLRDIQQILNESTKDLTAAEKQMALETIFGSDAIRAAAVLADGGAESFDAFGVKMEETGTAAEQAKIRQDNMKGSLEQLKGALETAGIIIGEQLIPPLTTLVGWLGQAFDWFSNLPGPVQTLLTYLAMGSAAFLLLGAGIIKTVQFFTGLRAAIGTLIPALAAKNAAEATSAASSTAASATSLFAWRGGILDTIRLWVMYAAEAVRNAVMTSVIWIQETARATAAAVASWVAAKVKIVAEWVAMVAAATVNAMKTAAVWVAQTVATTAKIIASWAVASAKIVAQWVLMGAKAMIQAAIIAGAWLLSNGAALATSLISMGVAVAATVGGWIAMGVAAMINAAILAAAWLIAFWPVALVIAAVVALAAVIYLFWDEIVAAFQVAIDWIVMAMGKLWEGIKAAWDFIVGVFQWAWDKIVEIFTAIFDFYVAIWTAIIKAFIAAGQAIWDALQQTWQWIQEIWDKILGFFRQIPGWISDVFSGAINWLMDAGRNILDGLWSGAKAVWNSVTGWLGQIGGWVKNAFSNAGQWLLDAGRWLVEGLWNGISGAAGWLYDQVAGWAGGIVDDVLGFFGIGSPSKVFADMGHWLAVGLGQGLEDSGHVAVDSAIGVAADVLSAMENELANGSTLGAAIDASLSPGALAALSGGVPALAGTVRTLAGQGFSGARASDTQAGTDAEFQRIVKMEFNTYNPVAERASDNEARKIRAAAAVGAF